VKDTAVVRKAVTSGIWHRRFGHANNLPKSNLIPKVKVEDCGTCYEEKGRRLEYPTRERRSSAPLDLVYSDVCSVNPETLGGGKCFLHSQMTIVGTVK
jgi:hypothetical protein